MSQDAPRFSPVIALLAVPGLISTLAGMVLLSRPGRALARPLVGAFGACGQILLTEAFRLGEASKVAPLEYTVLLWSLGIDLALWGVLPDATTWLGAAIIVASGLYLLRRERVHDAVEHP